jgi:prefoldin subunit 5
MKPEETTAGAKLVLPGGQKINLGLQGGSLAMLVWIGVQAASFVNRVENEAEATRAAIETLGERIDKVDDALAKLSENAAQIERLAAELGEQRLASSALATKIAAVEACARDKRRC